MAKIADACLRDESMRETLAEVIAEGRSEVKGQDVILHR